MRPTIRVTSRAAARRAIARSLIALACVGAATASSGAAAQSIRFAVPLSHPVGVPLGNGHVANVTLTGSLVVSATCAAGTDPAEQPCRLDVMLAGVSGISDSGTRFEAVGQAQTALAVDSIEPYRFGFALMRAGGFADPYLTVGLDAPREAAVPIVVDLAIDGTGASVLAISVPGGFD